LELPTDIRVTRPGRLTDQLVLAQPPEQLLEGQSEILGWAMSQENVEIVRQHIAAYESGNYDAALAAYHPDVVCDATVRPEGRIYRGREGVAEAIRVWAGTWDDWHWEIEELIGADDRVLMVVREFARGKGSGVEVVQQTFWVYTLRGGQIVHAKVLVDKSQALEAAGLSE
jgi:ketosteroid isomerase-like protein